MPTFFSQLQFSLNGVFTNASQLSPGIHVITAQVTDSNGNTGGDLTVLTVDANTPVVVDPTFFTPTGLDFSVTSPLTATVVTSGSVASWFYMNKARNTGKFAFEYTQTIGVGGTGNVQLGITPTNVYAGQPGKGGGAYAYINNANRLANNVQEDIGSPTVNQGESLLFMVDFDAGTIRIRNSSATISRSLYSNLTFAELGLRAGFEVSGVGKQIAVNMSGPFHTTLDPGYLPWASTTNQPPQLTINTPGAVFHQGDQIVLTGQAFDPEQGDISSTISWSSSTDGALGTGASLTKTLSLGTHTITATVTDGFNVTVTKTLSLTVQPKVNQLPLVTISSPQDESQVNVGATITLTATAQDPEDGNRSSTIQWKSDKDGVLGTGASLLGELDTKEEKEQQQAETEKAKPLLERIKKALEERVSEVRVTHRLTESPACLAVGEYDMGLQMRKIMEAAGQKVPDSKPIFEINTGHPLVQKLDRESDEERFSDLASILFDQASLAEGRQLTDPASYIARLNKLLLDLSR